MTARKARLLQMLRNFLYAAATTCCIVCTACQSTRSTVAPSATSTISVAATATTELNPTATATAGLGNALSLSGWNFLPLTTQIATSQQEGYSDIVVRYGVQNLSPDIEQWNNPVTLTLEAQVNSTGQTYDNSCAYNSKSFQPPEYWLVFNACFTIPTIATARTLVAVPDDGNPTRWDIATQVNGSNKLPSEPSENLMRVGQTFTIPGQVYTLQSVSVQRVCGPSLAEVWWQLNVNHELKNTGGTNTSNSVYFQVLDGQGNEYGLYPDDMNTFQNDPMEDVPPGLTHSNSVEIVLNTASHPSDNIECPDHPDLRLWPSVATGLQVVVQLTGSDGSYHYGVYSLGNPPVLPAIGHR